MNTDQILLSNFIERRPQQAVKALETLDTHHLSALINELPPELNLRIFNLVDAYKLTKCLPLLDSDLVVKIMDLVPIRLAEKILRQVDENLRSDLLEKISTVRSSFLKERLQYAVFSIGAVMNLSFLIIRSKSKVKEAIELVKRERDAEQAELYINDDTGKLVGVIGLHKLLFEEESSPLSSIMEEIVYKFSVDLPYESVINHPAWYDHSTVPVVDHSDTLIGTLSYGPLRNKIITGDRKLSNDLMETSHALGELYRIGLSGFLRSVTD